MTVARGTRGTMCTNCGQEPRRAGQRWGKACHAAAMKGYRRRQAAAARALAWEVADLRRQLRARPADQVHA